MNAFFQQCYPDLLALCRRRVRPQWGDPEDFVHQAYLRCRQGWSPARRSSNRVAAYFYRALRWVITDAARRHARRPSAGAAVNPAAAQASPLHELIAAEALKTLTARERSVCLGFMAGKAEAQLCAELGISADTLAVHLCRARRKLRQALDLPARPK